MAYLATFGYFHIARSVAVKKLNLRDARAGWIDLSVIDETVQKTIERDIKKNPRDFGYLVAGLLCIPL